MENRFYQNNPEYKSVEMTKKQLVAHLTKNQDACYDEVLAGKTYRIADILKKDFAYHFNPRYNRPLKKEVFIFHKGGTDICGGHCRYEAANDIHDPVKITVVIKQAGDKYEVYDFDWNDSFYGKMF